MAMGEEFDLMILDVMLPGKDGLTICKTVREAGIHTPILMLTAKGQISDKVTGLDVGADDYMVKPFSFEELFARVRALIRRPQKTNKTILKSHDLEVDTVRFKVTRQGKSIHLSSKEYAILEYLLRYKNKVITKDNLVSHIWDYDANVLPNVVEVHIKHLRDKVDTPFEKQLIKTMRGKGYIIDDE
jgi:DNA-binding response OmpR family regulator